MEEKKELQNQDERVVEIELERLRGFVNHEKEKAAGEISIRAIIKKYKLVVALFFIFRQSRNVSALTK